MASNLRISQDDCVINIADGQNKSRMAYQFFEDKYTQATCSGNIPVDKATNLYTDVQSTPVSLIDQESALRGLGQRTNACGVVCPGAQQLENREIYRPEFCPIIATKSTTNSCCE